MRDLYYDRKKKVLVVCLAGARLLLRPEKKKVLVVCLAGARLLLRPEKKSSSRLSGGCAIAITTGKKVLVVFLAGARSLLRPEKKKVLVVCLAGCAVVSVVGSGGNRFWLYILLCKSTIQLW